MQSPVTNAEVTARDLTALPGVIRRPVTTRNRNEGRPMLKQPSCGDRYSTLLTALIATHKLVSRPVKMREMTTPPGLGRPAITRDGTPGVLQTN